MKQQVRLDEPDARGAQWSQSSLAEGLRASRSSTWTYRPAQARSIGFLVLSAVFWSSSGV